jgi:hypothetical protein
MEKQRLLIIVQPACLSKLLMQNLDQAGCAMAPDGYIEHGEQDHW